MAATLWGIRRGWGGQILRRTFQTFSLIAFLSVATAPAAVSLEDCAAPDNVCAARDAVFPVSFHGPLGSAVRISREHLVTNRHVVADKLQVELGMPGGERLSARVVPTAYSGDLVLLHAKDLANGRWLDPRSLDPARELYTVGADLGSRAVRVYRPGPVIFAPAEEKPSARIHSRAYSQPGNSGGALVDERGRLVGIVTSGGEGRNEAIPAREIARLKRVSGSRHTQANARIGRAYRECSRTLEHARRTVSIGSGLALRLADSCGATGNRQMYDLAAQVLGQSRRFNEAIDLLRRSVQDDPNAVNSRLTLAVTYHLARRFDEEIEHLEWLVDAVPRDHHVLRLAIEAGRLTGSDALAERAFALLAEHHPFMAERVRPLMDNSASPIWAPAARSRRP